MKKGQMVAAAAVMAAMLAPVLAEANPITIVIGGGNTWELGAGWGPSCVTSACDSSHTLLNVDWIVDPSLSTTTFTLNHVGDSHSVRFGAAIFAEEDGVLAPEELDYLTVSAILSLNSPFPGATSHPAVVTASSGVLKDRGFPNTDLEIAFDPTLLNFGTGGQLQVDFSPLSWNCQGNDHCTYAHGVVQYSEVTFTLMKDSTAPAAVGLASAVDVPEPASLLLLAAGLVGVRVNRRNQKYC